MLPSTCVITSGTLENNPESNQKCPLCSNAVIRQQKLLLELEQIETKYLGKIHNDAIVRMQHDFYLNSYKKPLMNHGRNYIDISIDEIRHHFTHCRVSHERMILDDVQHVRKAQQTILNSQDEYSDINMTDANLRTWMQLSKHKHDLMRLLNPPQAIGKTSKSTTNPKLHSI